MSETRAFEEYDDLYERLLEDTQITEEYLRNKLDQLTAVGFIETILVNDRYVFGARNGLSWADFHQIDDPIKKRILAKFAT